MTVARIFQSLTSTDLVQLSVVLSIVSPSTAVLVQCPFQPLQRVQLPQQLQLRVLSRLTGDNVEGKP